MDELQLLANSLSKVEYLTTFNAFIFGYVVSRFFGGWARIISDWQSVHFSVEHFAWSLLSWGILIDLWWTAWMRLNYVDVNPVSFYVSMLSPFVMYLIASLYFPVFKNRPIANLKVYYSLQRRKGYFFYVIFFFTFIITSVFFEEIRFDIFFEILGVVFSLAAFFTNRKWLERTILALSYALLIFHYILMPSYYDNLQWSIDGFSFAEYTSFFITFIYGFIIAKFLDGWGYFVVNKSSLKPNLFYLMFTLLIFGLLVDFWWGLWERNELISKNFFHFFISLFVPMGFYILSSLLFPERELFKSGTSDIFNRNSRLIYCCFIFIFFFDFLMSQLLEVNVLFGPENIFRGLAILLAFLGIVINKRVIHLIILTFSWMLLILHIAQGFYLG